MSQEQTPDHGRAPSIRRYVKTGFVVNSLLGLLKLSVGLMGHSRALITDALHSLSDLGTDTLLLLGSRFWSQPPDARYPYGHHRIETLVSVTIALVLTIVAVSMGWGAVRALMRSEPAHQLGWEIFATALVSVVVKEWLYRFTMAGGRRLHSLACRPARGITGRMRSAPCRWLSRWVRPSCFRSSLFWTVLALWLPVYFCCEPRCEFWGQL